MLHSNAPFVPDLPLNTLLRWLMLRRHLIRLRSRARRALFVCQKNVDMDTRNGSPDAGQGYQLKIALISFLLLVVTLSLLLIEFGRGS